MFYYKKCVCCDAEFTLMYSGKNYLESLKKFNYEVFDAAEESGLNDLKLKIEKGNPYMAISMKEIPNIIKELQEAYKEYQEVQEEFKAGRLERSTYKRGELDLKFKQNQINDLNSFKTP